MGPELKTRLITAAILGGIVLLLLITAKQWCYGPLLLAMLAFAAVLVAAFEFTCLSGARSLGFLQRVGCFFVLLLAPAVLVAKIWLGSVCPLEILAAAVVPLLMLLVLFSALLLMMMIVFGAANQVENSGKMAQELFPALFLISLGGAALVVIPVLSGGAALTAWLLVVVCINDSAAYFCGRRLQGPRLAPAISPNKTISGALAGLFAGVLAGILLYRLLPLALSFLEIGLLAIVIAIAAQVGDLLESFLKRLHAVKESGKLLPGHGGLLDRIDGLLFAAPFLLFTLAILSKG